MLKDSDAPDDSPSGNASSDAIGRRLVALSLDDFNLDSTSCLPSFFVAAFVAGEVVPLPSASLRLVPDPFFISTLPAGSSLDPARGGDLLETEAARSQNSNLWLPRALLSVGFNFQI